MNALILVFLGVLAHAEDPINHASVRKVVNSHLADIKVCFDAARKDHPEESGQIMVDFTIDDAGHVVKAAIDPLKNVVKDAALDTCMKAAIRGWKFPETHSGELADITYPFDLGK